MKLNYFESALQCKFKIRVFTCFYSPGLVLHSPKSKERVEGSKSWYEGSVAVNIIRYSTAFLYGKNVCGSS